MRLVEQVDRLLTDNVGLRAKLRNVSGDTPPPGGPSDPTLPDRVEKLEEDIKDIKKTLIGLEPMIVRIDATTQATLPHLATKAELAEKPSKTYLWMILGVLIAAYGVGLAGIAVFLK